MTEEVIGIWPVGMLGTSFDLLMSSGFLCFSSHAGFLKALEATGARPSAFVGTSSGSLAAAFSAAGLSAEEVKRELGGQRPISLVRPSSRPWIGPMSSRGLVKKLQTVLPETFEDLEAPLAVGVYATAHDSKDKVPMLVTSGGLPEAVAASCAVPGLFRPLHLAGRGGIAIGADGTVHELPSEDTPKPQSRLRSYADGGAVDRTMYSAWAHWRPHRSALVHLVSPLPDGDFGPRDGLPRQSVKEAGSGGSGGSGGSSVGGIVRTPRAKASFFSLKDYDAQVDAAAAAAERQLEALLSLRGGGWAVDALPERSSRREALTIAAAVATSALLAPPRALAAAKPPFRLTLPPDFVKIGSTNGQDVLLMAGDFRGMIAGTGSATTIAVQRVAMAERQMAPRGEEAVAEMAARLTRLRDTQAAPSGCVSELVPSSLAFDGTTLTFEFFTPLVCAGTSLAETPADFKRHTLARAVADQDGGGLLVLWAGARASDWDAGAGEALRAAAATFGPLQGLAAALPSDSGPSVEAPTNAHHGPA